jgi:hypothetical protein
MASLTHPLGRVPGRISAARMLQSAEYQESPVVISIRIMSFKKPLARRPSAIIFLTLSVLSGAVFFTPSAAIAQKEYTAEQIVESAIAMAGGGFGRAVLTQIRRNGIEIGKVTRTRPDGRSEEIRYERRFIHNEKPEKDKVRIDNKSSQTEFSIIWDEGRLFGIIGGSTFTPRPEVAAEFISQEAHSIDALLRYKENESKISSAGKDKQQGVDLYVIDLVDKANRKTRYFISAKTFRVFSLEFEEIPPNGTAAVKYTKRFYDYRLAQGTQVPYRTVQMEDGKQTLETRILTVTYGVKMEDSLFKNPEASAASSSP